MRLIEVFIILVDFDWNEWNVIGITFNKELIDSIKKKCIERYDFLESKDFMVIKIPFDTYIYKQDEYEVKL